MGRIFSSYYAFSFAIIGAFHSHKNGPYGMIEIRETVLSKDRAKNNGSNFSFYFSIMLLVISGIKE